MKENNEIQVVGEDQVQLVDKENTPLLTKDQERFCQLYVCGGVQYAGQLTKCYEKVFGISEGGSAFDARELTRNPAVMARIRELGAEMVGETESIAIKMQIGQTLRTIMEETSSGFYKDRYGKPASPAALRAVAVNAARALMELYPVKTGGDAKFKIEGNDNNIVFNVIVPRIENSHAGEQEE